MGNDDNWQRFFQEQKDRESAEAHRRMEEADRFDPEKARGAPMQHEWRMLEQANAEVQEEVEGLKRRGCRCDLDVSGGFMTPDWGPQIPFLHVTPEPGCPIPEHEEMLAPTPDPAPTSPGYAGGDDGSASSARSEGSRKRPPVGVWLLCALVAVAAIVVATDYSALTTVLEGVEAPPEVEVPPARSPEETLALQYERINAGDYEGAYELFAGRSKRVVSPEQYRAFFEANAPYEISEYSVSPVEERGDRATVEAVLIVNSATGEESYPITQRLVREDEGWRVVMRDAQIAAFT